MSYNFADTNQVNKFKTKAKAGGYDDAQITRYINNKMKSDLSLKKMQTDYAKLSGDVSAGRELPAAQATASADLTWYGPYAWPRAMCWT